MGRGAYILGRSKYFILIFFLLNGVLSARQFNAEMVGQRCLAAEENEDRKVNYSQKDDKWLGPDKAKHFLAGAFSTIFIYKTCEDVKELDQADSKIYAVSLSALISVGKEIIDARSADNHFCKKDLLYDALGIFTGLIIVNQR